MMKITKDSKITVLKKGVSKLGFNDKKGIAAFNLLKGGAVAMGLAAIFGAAMALALSKIADVAGPAVGTEPLTNITINGTTGARMVALNGTEGILQMFTLLPTQGIILGIVVLIAIVLLIKTKQS